ncbi:hypothetical protein KI387_025603, partial [Taxus chinensis]
MGTVEHSTERPHLVLFPFPAQGHINPLMEFAKRLVPYNLHVTFVVTQSIRERMLEAQKDAAPATSPLTDIRIETISDGLSPDNGEAKDVKMVIGLLREVGGRAFERLIEKLNSQNQRVSCIVYGSLLEWVPHIANKLSIPCAFFWTQSCAVYSIYYHYHNGL